MIKKNLLKSALCIVFLLLLVTTISGQSNQYVDAKLNLNKTMERIFAQSLENVRIIVEFDDYLTNFHKEFLEESNISYVKPVAEKAYIFSVPSSRIEYLAAMGFIKEVRDLDIDRKTSYSLRNNIFLGYARGGTDKYKIVAQFYEETSFDEANNVAKKYGELIDSNFDFKQLIILIKKDKIRHLAEEEKVEYLTFISPPPSVGNNGSRRAISANIVQESPYGLTGSSVDIGIWDGGKVDNTHDDFRNRITVVETSGSVNQHATHVAGTLAGDGNSSSGTYKGVAPSSELYSYNFFGVGNDPSSEHNGAINTYGIEISQNSWGDLITNSFCHLFGSYDLREKNYDHIVKGKYGKRIPVVFITHNFRDDPICNISQNGGYDTVTAPGTAKNVISVGATNSDDDSMTLFSGWGPTDDGRLKPDIVAPGCEDDDNKNVLDPSKSIWSAKSTDTYGGDCGTSMAAPAVSGTIALMYEQFRCTSALPSNPLPSTIKALLVHTAKDLGAAGPDYKYGYGRINATEAIDHVIYRYFRETNLSSSTEIDKFNLTLNDSTQAIKVTLAWDDKEGTLNSTKDLINDLDLYLLAPNGTLFKSWTLDPNNPSSPATKDGNHRDNIEQVVIGPPIITNGSWKIIVNATSCPECPQTYSLVYKRPFEINLKAAKGTQAFYLISAPLIPRVNMSQVFGDSYYAPCRVYQFNGSWRSYSCGQSANSLNHFAEGLSYWANVTWDATLEIAGDPITNNSQLFTKPIRLYEGENQIGYNSFFEIPVNESLNGLTPRKLWAYKGKGTSGSPKKDEWNIYYDNETFEYANFNLVPGWGIEVDVDANTTWSIPQTRSCSSLNSVTNELGSLTYGTHPFVLYGTASCTEILNKTSQNVMIRLKVNGTEITNYTMGGVDVNQYRLQVPVGEGGLGVNDSAEIFINNLSIGSNVTIGESGELRYVNISVANQSTDLDGDNFSGNCSDCNDTNASINPNAVEVCTDNIDNDCDSKIDCADTNCASDEACLITNVTVSSISSLFISPTQRVFESTILNNGQTVLRNITWSINLGDGTVVNGTRNTSIALGENVFVYFEHNYSSVGDYTINTTARGNNLSASLTNTIEIEYLGVSNFSTLDSNSSINTFEAYVKNYMNLNMTNISWSLNTGNAIVSSTSPITLDTQKLLLVFIEYNYSVTGNFTANFTAVNGSWSDLEALNVTIT